MKTKIVVITFVTILMMISILFMGQANACANSNNDQKGSNQQTSSSRHYWTIGGDFDSSNGDQTRSNKQAGSSSNWWTSIGCFDSNGGQAGSSSNWWNNGGYSVTNGPVSYGTQSSLSFQISCTQQDHNTYGLAYPVTYVFSYTGTQTNLQAYVKHSLFDDWNKITEYVSTQLYSGVEAVRFDYKNNIAYVSVAFSDGSNNIYIKLVSRGNTIPITYQGTTNFYDNRKTAVTVTMDDVLDNAPWGTFAQYVQASKVFSNDKVSWTAGIVDGWYVNWTALQIGVNTGYVEIASHSQLHPNDAVQYQSGLGYNAEIGGSKQYLLGNLTNLPYSKGNKEYIWTYMEPSGYDDSTVELVAGQNNYLVTRATASEFPALVSPWATWNPTAHIYSNGDSGQLIDDDYPTNTLQVLNSQFDSVRATGGIYTIWGHIGQNTWTPGGKAYQHIQYISGHTDCWYVGYGLMYLYHYTQQIVQVANSS
jgi:hypothetical protein